MKLMFSKEMTWAEHVTSQLAATVLKAIVQDEHTSGAAGVLPRQTPFWCLLLDTTTLALHQAGAVKDMVLRPPRHR